MTPLFPQLDHWDPAPLRRALTQGGYRKAALEELGLPGHWLRSSIRRAALLGHVPENSAVEGLIRLFTLGDGVPADLALRALGAAGPGLVDLGFLEKTGGEVRSRFQLIPVNDGWVACDFPRRQGEGAADFVMGIGPSSLLIASLVPPVAGRVLELASGVGWLASNLTRAGRPVTATDVNPRALDLGRFTTRLNGVSGVDFRQGDGFSAVAGESFDLIVSNPPYVQSPGGHMKFREGAVDDPICARLVRETPAHLNPEGIAVLLVNWMHRDDDDWAEVPLSWVRGEGLRRWVFRSDCSTPADYAWNWIAGDLRFAGEAAALAEMRRWLDYYRKQGVGRISGGFMVMQKCAPGGEWTRTESRAAESLPTTAGADVLRVLRNETWLASGPDLLESRYVVPDGVLAEVRMRAAAAGWARETVRLTSPARLSYDGQVDENTLRLIELAGAGEAPAAMVREIMAKPEFATLPDVPQRVEELVRDLVSHGILVPRSCGDGIAEA